SSAIFLLWNSRLFTRSLLTCDSAMSARSSASSSSCWILRNLESPTHPGLQLLDLFLPSLQGQLLSLFQTVLQVLHSLVQVLLHPLQVGTGVSLHLLLHIQAALQGLHHSQMVSLQLVNLLIFLCYLPVNLRLDLVELKLQAQDLPLFMF
uniref:Uncharacterized protein n=1 Tax=Malurus cyaneus samueli TaxID=2593467 RepID=A0A8C5U831_9PASS